MKKEYELFITCPKCKEQWNPDPSKWKNHYSMLNGEGKVLHCPFCNKVLKLSKEETKRILGAWEKRLELESIST